MKKKQVKKLSLRKETLEHLDHRMLDKLHGGATADQHLLSDSVPECCGCSRTTGIT